MRSIDAYLVQYAQSIIKRWSEDDARRYLRACAVVWREHYGERIADRVGNEINGFLNDRRVEKRD